VRSRLGPERVSERRACRVLGQPRNTQRYQSRRVDDEPRLLREMRLLARQRPRFGSGRIHRLLTQRGWTVNEKRVHRLWKREHMQVPRKQHRKRRLPGGSGNGCVRHRARYKDHVWSYDFVTDRTEDGRQLRLLVVIDEFTRECLAIEVGRSFTAQDVVGVLQYLFAVRGTPEHIRSDNGPEFVSKVICRWLKEADVKTLFVAKGSPWENGYVESFNGTLRDELLNREIFLSFEEACWVIDRWRLDYNHHRIHSSLDYQTPAAYAAGCVLPASATPQPPEHSRFTNPNPLTQPGAKTGG
jgi:putative transposase